ncbi:DUF443 family protein [Paraliobacillus sp. JSM ZJ581]|uniref:DUF443 family protein n=1 Tax=Paraliobacillus sp. JSM ZJ581 TaxID=3342118 RepID=UPI0035A8B7ED
MKCIVIKIRNTRFRALKIEGDTYTLDMSQSVWKILFPFLTWLLPNTVYQVDEEVLNEKIGSVENNTKNNKISVLFFSGVSIFLANLLRPLTDFFDFESTLLINCILTAIMLIIATTFRFYLSHQNKKEFYKIIEPHLILKKNIWIRPQSLKHLLKSLTVYLGMLISFLFTFALFFTYSNIMALIWTMVFSLFLSVTNATTVIEGTTTVKFKEKR